MYDGATDDGLLSPQVAQLHGDSTPAPIESTGRDMYLKFESDGSVSTAGFQIQFEQGKSNVNLFMTKLRYSTLTQKTFKLVAYEFHSK